MIESLNEGICAGHMAQDREHEAQAMKACMKGAQSESDTMGQSGPCVESGSGKMYEEEGNRTL